MLRPPRDPNAPDDPTRANQTGADRKQEYVPVTTYNLDTESQTLSVTDAAAILGVSRT